MDIGLIAGVTSEPPQQEKSARKAVGSGFAGFLEKPDAAPERDIRGERSASEKAAPAKEKNIVRESRASAAASSNTRVSRNEAEAATPDTSPTTSDAPAAAGNEQAFDNAAKTAAAAGSEEAAVLPETTKAPTADRAAANATPAAAAALPETVAAPANENHATPPLQTMTPTAPTAASDTAAMTHATPDARKAAAAKTDGQAPLPPQAADAAIKATATVRTGPEMRPATNTAAAETAPVPLTALRNDANAGISEKEMLAEKIAEMLRDGNGSLAATSGKKQGLQSTLANSATLVTASLATNPAAQGAGAAASPASPAGATAGTDALVLPQATPAVAATSVAASDAVAQIMPAAPAGSVQNVEATAANNMSQAAQTARVLHLPPAEQLSTHIGNAIRDGQDRIKISLHPSELGRVEVKLDIGHDGRILAAVSVERPETLDLLQRDARSLERALQDAGFETGSGSLSFSLQQQGGDGADREGGFAKDSSNGEALVADAPLPDAPREAYRASRAGNGNLDIEV